MKSALPIICSAQNAIVAGFFLRISVAVWNSFYGPSFGAGPDAGGYHLGAVSYSNGMSLGVFQISSIYMYALGTFYSWTAPSLFLGSALSCTAWLGSAILLFRMAKLLMLNDSQQFLVALIYALLPSSILITSVTLREAYQLLAVNLVIYSALKIYLEKSIYYWILMLTGVVFMGMLHGGLIVAGFSVAAITFLVIFFDKRESLSLIRLSLVTFTLLLVTYVGSSIFLELAFNVNTSLGEAIQARHDSWQKAARASYSIGLRIHSDIDLLLFIPAALFNYLFQPFPWRAETTLDWALVIENLFRGYLLYRAIANLLYSSGEKKMAIGLVFSAYLAIEIIWALGTINWGTAVRHHIPAFGLLLLCSFTFPGNGTLKILKY